jgi:hypothetical protein
MAVQLAHTSGAHVTALVRAAATFGLAIEHLRPRGVVVNIATQDDEETVSFRAKNFVPCSWSNVTVTNIVSDRNISSRDLSSPLPL